MNEGKIMKIQKQMLESSVLMVPVTFVEEILSAFLSKVLSLNNGRSPKHRCLSRAEMNEIAENLKQSMEQGLSKHKIYLVAVTDEQHLNPEYEETINQVVHSVYSNILQKSGSVQDIYDDITGCRKHFPQEVATVIIEEISSCPLLQAASDSPSMLSKRVMKPSRIADKVFARVSINTEPKTATSGKPITDETANKNPTETEDLPVKIIPYLRNKPLPIDPNLVSNHLAVISIKTEPLEELKKICFAQTGHSLRDIRRASMAGKYCEDEIRRLEAGRKKGRCFSVGNSGRLDVRPMEPFSRNSFQNVLEPDITRVELLKDVQTKEDLVVRLVVHDIENNEEEEQVVVNLKAEDWEYDEEDDDEMQQEEEEKEISEDIIKVESSHLMMSLLTSSMDNEQLSVEEFEEASSAFQAQHKSTCASLCHTRDTKASAHSSKVDGASPSSHIASSMIRCCFNCFRSNRQKTPLRKDTK